MIDVGAVVQSWQVADEANAADRAPADVFDQSVVYLGLRSDHHGAAGEFAVVKGQKKTGTAVDFAVAIDAQGKRTALQASKRNKDCGLVAQFAPGTEFAGAQGSNVGGESHAEKVDEVQRAVCMDHAQNVTGVRAMREDRFDGIFDAAL